MRKERGIEYFHVVLMSAPRWANGLSAAGLYYDGIIDGNKIPLSFTKETL